MKHKILLLIKYSLVIIYVWFGLLKVLGVSPAADLIRSTHPWLPEPASIIILGYIEIIIGILLIFKKTMRWGLILMWLQLACIFAGLLFSPSIYFSNGDVFFLTLNGEFVIKNLIIFTASYALWESA